MKRFNSIGMLSQSTINLHSRKHHWSYMFLIVYWVNNIRMVIIIQIQGNSWSPWVSHHQNLHSGGASFAYTHLSLMDRISSSSLAYLIIRFSSDSSLPCHHKVETKILHLCQLSLISPFAAFRSQTFARKVENLRLE